MFKAIGSLFRTLDKSIREVESFIDMGTKERQELEKAQTFRHLKNEHNRTKILKNLDRYLEGEYDPRDEKEEPSKEEVDNSTAALLKRLKALNKE